MIEQNAPFNEKTNKFQNHRFLDDDNQFVQANGKVIHLKKKSSEIEEPTDVQSK